MAYSDDVMSNRVIERTSVPVVDYHDRVRWGPIIAGLVIALSSQLILSALGAALGSSTIATSGAPRTNADNVGAAVGIWAIVSLFISLFIGGWATARACGPMNRNTALLNGAILWATTLAVSAWLLSSGVSGAFGIVGANASTIINQAQQTPVATPEVTAQQTRDIADALAKAGWAFSIGSLLGLAASLIGSSLGTHRPRSEARA